MTRTPLRISPSTLSFLWDECRACFYEAVVNRSPRPSTPFPAVFNKLDALQKKSWVKIPVHKIELAGLSNPLPEGTIQTGDLWVRSKPFLVLPNRSFQFVGKMDLGIDFVDQSIGVIDFKTATPNDEYFIKYGRQLNAYRYCLENPEEGDAERVSRMGLIYHTPSSMEFTMGTLASSINFMLEWVEIERHEIELDTDLIALLSSSKVPAHERSCGFWPHYKHTNKETT